MLCESSREADVFQNQTQTGICFKRMRKQYWDIWRILAVDLSQTDPYYYCTKRNFIEIKWWRSFFCKIPPISIECKVPIKADGLVHIRLDLNNRDWTFFPGIWQAVVSRLFRCIWQWAALKLYPWPLPRFCWPAVCAKAHHMPARFFTHRNQN